MKRNLAGWGNYPRAAVRLIRACGRDEIHAALAASASIIARGNGRAYGDCALNKDATLSLLLSDRILAFDAATGLLTCEAGVLLADLLDIFVPRGWFIPVTPGTKFVTVGGMIAADVHGKNHHWAGSFGNHVVQFTLMLADGREVTCSATQNPQLFAATCGGMGLTGVILRASFLLIPIETAFIRQKTLRTENLAQTMAVFEQSNEWAYSVAWIDCLARGAALGRCVIYLGEHARRGELSGNSDPLQHAAKKTWRLAFNLPGFTLNRWSIAAFNALYYARAREGTRMVDYESFFYPLDALREWNRIYGGQGFVQYQCVLPKANGTAGITALLLHISNAGLGSFLAVLKLLSAGNGYISFPLEGYTLALDFPANPKVFSLLGELDAIVMAHGGRIYLAKDSRMGVAMMREGYPGLDAFNALRREVDPAAKFSSLQSQRLGL